MSRQFVHSVWNGSAEPLQNNVNGLGEEKKLLELCARGREKNYVCWLKFRHIAKGSRDSDIIASGFWPTRRLTDGLPLIIAQKNNISVFFWTFAHHIAHFTIVDYSESIILQWDKSIIVKIMDINPVGRIYSGHRHLLNSMIEEERLGQLIAFLEMCFFFIWTNNNTPVSKSSRSSAE